MLRELTPQTKALLDLADFIDELDANDYDQRSFHSCICGWCNKRAGREMANTTAAAAELGISNAVAAQLFNGDAGRKRISWWRFGFEPPTNKDAARTLRYLAVTGELPKDW
jgi:hypothetical protein